MKLRMVIEHLPLKISSQYIKAIAGVRTLQTDVFTTLYGLFVCQVIGYHRHK